MPIVQDILAVKGTRMHSISPDATVLEATQKMNQFKIGALVVMHQDQIIGMFTERDVLQRVVATERSPARLHVQDVMTQDVICCHPDTDIEEASAIMKNHRIRHLPVCTDDGEIAGLISIGDLNACYASSQQQQVRYLNDYIFGRA